MLKAQIEAAANMAVQDASVSTSDPDAVAKIKRMQAETGSKLIFTEHSRIDLSKTAKMKMDEGQKRQSHLLLSQQDPNSGQWGGLATNADKQLSARVTEIRGTELFNVEITLKALTPEAIPDGTVALISLHPTFDDPYRLVVVRQSIATITCVAWGAFTVGAICDGTELELDLAKLLDAPIRFKSR